MLLCIVLPEDGLKRPKHVAGIIHNEDTDMVDERKYEIYLEMQEHNVMIFTKRVFLVTRCTRIQCSFYVILQHLLPHMSLLPSARRTHLPPGIKYSSASKLGTPSLVFTPSPGV